MVQEQLERKNEPHHSWNRRKCVEKRNRNLIIRLDWRTMRSAMSSPPSSISFAQRWECYFAPVIVHLSLGGEIDANVHGRTEESSLDALPVIPLASSHRRVLPGVAPPQLARKSLPFAFFPAVVVEQHGRTNGHGFGALV